MPGDQRLPGRMGVPPLIRAAPPPTFSLKGRRDRWRPAYGQALVEEIRYVTCDGSQWTATLDGDRFWHFPRDPETQAERHESRNIRYRTWGGGCWNATWDARRRVFLHTPVAGGTGHPDTILNYEDWSGVRWTARRNRDDWIVRRG